MTLRSTTQLRQIWGPNCATSEHLAGVKVGGRTIWMRKEVIPAVRQVDKVFSRHNYPIRNAGGHNCRKVTGGVGLSLHSFGIAFDVNSDTNPYRTDRMVTDMSPEMIQDIKDIRTSGGHRVWRCGVDFNDDGLVNDRVYDPMHFECVASPGELASGFDDDIDLTLPVRQWPVISIGSTGNAVTHLQMLLQNHVPDKIMLDGMFGPKTETAVIAYQGSRGLVPDGIVGPQTWTALSTNQPRFIATGNPPDKGLPL